MNPLRSARGLAAALTILGASSAGAQKLDDYQSGDTVTGETVDFEKLKGRVIALEYWGPR